MEIKSSKFQVCGYALTINLHLFFCEIRPLDSLNTYRRLLFRALRLVASLKTSGTNRQLNLELPFNASSLIGEFKRLSSG